MEKYELGKLIDSKSRLQGKFTLRDGKEVSFYYDKFMFETDPVLLRNITTYLAKLIPQGVELIAGAELGGISLATALSLETNMKSVFVRKEAKSYGTAKTIEGPSVEGKTICIVEDVITSGQTTIEVATKLRNSGAIVKHAVCVINRNPGSLTRLGEAGLQLFPLFELDETQSGLI